MKLITETHADHIRGVLSCYGRIIIQGTLPPFCYADGMTSFLYKQKIRIFDYKQQFAQPLRDAIIHNAKQIAHANGLTVEYLKKKNFRKEARIADILKKRGNHPGIVHIFSALEPSSSYLEFWVKPTTYSIPAILYFDVKTPYLFYISTQEAIHLSQKCHRATRSQR